MLDRKTLKRALEKAGFVHLRPGWVRKEAAPRLQDKIDRAVAEARMEVELIRLAQEDLRLAEAADGVEQVKREVR